MTRVSLTADRRQMLQSGAAAALFSALLPINTQAAAHSSLRPLLAKMADQILALSPQSRTNLGLDHGQFAGAKARLDDVSPRADDAFARQLISMKKQLSALHPKSLSAQDALLRDTVLYAVDKGLKGTQFSYGRGAVSGFSGGAVPYVVTQQNGALSNVPEFLNSTHQIETKADAEAYVARVKAFTTQLDQETDRIKSDARHGVFPPDFIAATTLKIYKDYLGTKPQDQGLVTSLATRTAKAGIAGDWAGMVTKLVEHDVYPAVERQMAAFAASTRSAPHTAGVQRLPEGEAYYQWALEMGTTTTYTAKEIHQIGLDQNKAIQARIDALLQQQGLTKGSVGERVQALNSDPKFLYPNTDEGRAQLIAYLNDCIARVRPILPKISHLGLKADVMVKRVPVDIQDGAALGYMNFASLDGARPAIYYVNLKSTDLWPKYQLPTLTAHEGVPGHTWQGAYIAEHHNDIPLISSMLGFNAFVEGWALYAEQLVDEMGVYDNDPFAKIGYLQAQQFRACRLVVDTGLNAMGWSREQSVAFLRAETGKGEAAMTSETDRYCASPGQACGYKMGHNEILRLRAKTMQTLGPKFDLAAFNDTIVKTCGVPLSLLPHAIDAYVAQVQNA